MTAELWVVIPAFNEGQRLCGVLDDVLTVTPNVIVVGDGSTDHTCSVARSRDVWLLRHAVNLGQGAALQTGLDFAIQKGARFIATFDADGQHSAQDLSRMLSVLIDEEADFVLGSRFLGRTEGIADPDRQTGHW